MNQVRVTVVGRERAMRRVDAIAAGLKAVQRHVATESAKAMRTELRGAAARHHRTGNMERSIKSRTKTIDGNLVLRFIAIWYAHFTTRGAKPHEIRARKQSFLTLLTGFHVKKVEHPGVRPDRWDLLGYYRALPQVQEIVRAAGAVLMGR